MLSFFLVFSGLSLFSFPFEDLEQFALKYVVR